MLGYSSRQLRSEGHNLSHHLARYYMDIVLWEVTAQIPRMEGSAICCHDCFVVVCDGRTSTMVSL